MACGAELAWASTLVAVRVRISDYDELSTWAEDEMRLNAKSATTRRADAAAKGQAALEAALGDAQAVERAIRGGRPPLDPDARPGQHSPSRTVRLTSEVDERLNALAAAQRRRPSDIIREALDSYLEAHRAS